MKAGDGSRASLPPTNRSSFYKADGLLVFQRTRQKIHRCTVAVIIVLTVREYYSYNDTETEEKKKPLEVNKVDEQQGGKEIDAMSLMSPDIDGVEVKFFFEEDNTEAVSQETRQLHKIKGKKKTRDTEGDIASSNVQVCRASLFMLR